MIGRNSTEAFEAHPGAPVPSCLVFLILTTEDKHPRDSRINDRRDNYQEKA